MTDNQPADHHGDFDSSQKQYPNDTMRLLCERASCRSFESEDVPGDVLKAVLRAGIHAPTGGNLQPYSIIKTENKTTCEKLAKLCSDQPWIAEAPVNLLFCIDYHRLERWANLEVAPFTATNAFRHFWIGFQDTIIAAQNICTAADAMGLGSVYIGTVLECFRQLRDMFELPKGVIPVVLLSMGYPRTRPQPRRKLGVDVMVHDEKYRELDDQSLVDAFHEKYPQSKREINDERLKTIESVCRSCHGEVFAEKCLERINQQGYISVAHNYFGLHYRADQMPLGNDDYLAVMEEFGCSWFRPYSPASSPTKPSQ